MWVNLFTVQFNFSLTTVLTKPVFLSTLNEGSTLKAKKNVFLENLSKTETHLFEVRHFDTYSENIVRMSLHFVTSKINKELECNMYIMTKKSKYCSYLCQRFTISSYLHVGCVQEIQLTIHGKWCLDLDRYLYFFSTSKDLTLRFQHVHRPLFLGDHSALRSQDIVSKFYRSIRSDHSAKGRR